MFTLAQIDSASIQQYTLPQHAYLSTSHISMITAVQLVLVCLPQHSSN
jgi:hypothetical protein